MRPKNELLELIRRNDIEGYNLYMESGNEALFRELALNEEFFACGMKKYESALIAYGVSHDNTLLKNVATDICMSLGYPDDVSISHISGIIEDNHMDNYYHAEALTAEQPKTTPIMTTNNNPTEAQTNEQIILSGLVTIGTAKGSRTLSTLERIHALNESGMVYTASHAVYNFAKSAGKRFGFVLESDIELIANLVMSNLDMLIDRISEEKPAKTTTRKGGIVDTACLTYAVGVIRGDVLKNARVAKNCKDLALKMLVNPGFDINDLPMSIDSLANKVYASIRSQAKKNGEQFAKSNTATKNAVKTTLIETIEALRLEHGTEYEILIDNMPKQPKHLAV